MSRPDTGRELGPASGMLSPLKRLDAALLAPVRAYLFSHETL